MSDSKKPTPGQPQYLPRSWKPTPEPTPTPPLAAGSDTPRKKKAKIDDAASPPPAAPKKKTKKGATGLADEGTGASKLEETPLLDTYEARQRVRLALGAAASLVGLVVLIMVVRRFQPPPPEASPTAHNEHKIVVDPRESAEKEAALLLDSAKQSDNLGRIPAALNLLQRVSRSYEGTAAAREANAALDRDRRNRPLFEVEEPKKATSPPAPTVATAAPATPATPPPTVGPPVVLPPPIVARTLPSDYRAEPSSDLHPSGWPGRIIANRDGMTLLLVPGGEFLMGRDDGEASERPAHRVRLGTFYVDQHEVTNRQYQTFLKESGRTPEAVTPERLDLPVVSITATEARTYCQWANRRLPTEAQWEFAARSSDSRVGYGASLRVDPKAPLRSAMSEAGDRAPCGACDMAANAAEWTSDYFDPNFYRQAGPLSIEPAGPLRSRVKPPLLTVKGHSPTGILTDREGVAVAVRQPYLGFRGVLPVESLAPAANAASHAAPGTPGVGMPADSASGVTPF